LSLISKFLEEDLSASDKRSDNAQVASVNRVVCLHGPEHSIVEARHDKGLGKVIEMLTHRDNIVAFAPRAGVNHTSLHTGTERADRVFLHAETCSLNQSITLNPVGYPDTLHVFD